MSIKVISENDEDLFFITFIARTPADRKALAKAIAHGLNCWPEKPVELQNVTQIVWGACE